MGFFGLGQLIPALLRRRLSRLRFDAQALPEFLEFAAAARPPVLPRPVLYYGRKRIPGTSELVHGGLVKTQRMQRSWPNTPLRFNTLYLVSSAIPPGARWLVWLAKRRGIRFVWNQNGVSTPAWEADWRETNDTLRPLLQMADYVFYQSNFCKMAADRFVAPPSGAWEILHNSVDTRIFAPATKLPQSPLVLILGGNQSERYRFEAAVTTLGALRRRGHDVRLIVTGRLRWRSDAETAIREAHEIVVREAVVGSVDLVGPYLQSEAPDTLRRAHILLHTTFNDACPGLVVEAMACGLPVVYSASGGVPELVGDEAGVGVPTEPTFDRVIPPDPAALADAVERVHRDFEAYSEAARKRAVRLFDIEPWLARHADVFQRARL